MKAFSFILITVLAFWSITPGQQCDDFSKYIMNYTSTVRDNYSSVYNAWDNDQATRGWYRNRLAMIGNSITNAHPYMSPFKNGVNSSVCQWNEYQIFGYRLCGPRQLGSDCWLYTDKGGDYGNASGMKASWGCQTGVVNALNNLKPMWSIIMFGTNDVKGGSFGLNTSSSGGMRCILDKLLAENVMPVLSAIPPIDRDAVHDQLVLEVRDSIKYIAEEYNLIWLDLLQAFMDYGTDGGKSLLSDDLHPTNDIDYCGSGIRFNSDCLAVHGYNVRTKLSTDVLMVLFDEVVNGASTTAGERDISRLRHVGPLEASPNPFNHSLNMSFQNPMNRANITIFNLDGSVVKTLSDVRSNSVTWNASSLNNGIYVVQVKADDRSVQTKLVTLIK